MTSLVQSPPSERMASVPELTDPLDSDVMLFSEIEDSSSEEKCDSLNHDVELMKDSIQSITEDKEVSESTFSAMDASFFSEISQELDDLNLPLMSIEEESKQTNLAQNLEGLAEVLNNDTIEQLSTKNLEEPSNIEDSSKELASECETKKDEVSQVESESSKDTKELSHLTSTQVEQESNANKFKEDKCKPVVVLKEEQSKLKKPSPIKTLNGSIILTTTSAPVKVTLAQSISTLTNSSTNVVFSTKRFGESNSSHNGVMVKKIRIGPQGPLSGNFIKTQASGGGNNFVLVTKRKPEDGMTSTIAQNNGVSTSPNIIHMVPTKLQEKLPQPIIHTDRAKTNCIPLNVPKTPSGDAFVCPLKCPIKLQTVQEWHEHLNLSHQAHLVRYDPKKAHETNSSSDHGSILAPRNPSIIVRNITPPSKSKESSLLVKKDNGMGNNTFVPFLGGTMSGVTKNEMKPVLTEGLPKGVEVKCAPTRGITFLSCTANGKVVIQPHASSIKVTSIPRVTEVVCHKLADPREALNGNKQVKLMKRITCPYCPGVHFPNQRQYRNHFFQHASQLPFKCHCGIRFWLEDSLQEHQANHQIPGKPKVPLEQDLTKMKAHFKVYCNMCSSSWARNSFGLNKYRNHLYKRHELDMELVEMVCDDALIDIQLKPEVVLEKVLKKSRMQVSKEALTLDVEETETEDIECCPALFDDLLDQDGEMLKDDFPFKSEPMDFDSPGIPIEANGNIPQNAIRRAEEMSVYRVTRASDGLFYCPYNCREKGFRVRLALLDHINVHTGEEPHQCGKCPKSFRTAGAWRRHHYIFHGLKKKRIKCQHCHQRFESIESMREHRSIHPELEPLKFECHKCAYLFSDADSLEKHIEGKHRKSISKLTCDQCGAEFRRADSWTKHKMTHLQQCARCEIVFRSKNELMEHRIEVHGDLPLPSSLQD